MKWTQTEWDGSYGVGQQMSALSAVGSNMIRVGNLKAPYTRDTGGESVGDPNAGTDAADGGSGGEEENHVLTDPITTGDKAGAGILTAIVLIALLGGGYVSTFLMIFRILGCVLTIFAVDVCRLIGLTELAFLEKGGKAGSQEGLTDGLTCE